MAEHGKFAAVNFSPCASQPGYWRHVETRDDSHHGVKVANVDALTSNLNPKLYCARPVFLLSVGADAGCDEEGEPVEPGDVGLEVAGFLASSKSSFLLFLC